MPTFPDNLIAPLLTALVAAIISLLGLIISKEQKISDLRQAWLDALREDVSQLMAHASELAFNPYQFGDTAEGRTRATATVQEANVRMYRVRLRLDLNEPEARDLEAALNEYERLAQIDPHPPEEEMGAAESEMVRCSQALIRKTWDRVKNGERAYQVMRGILSVFLILFVGLLFISIFQRKHTLTDEGEFAGDRANYSVILIR